MLQWALPKDVGALAGSKPPQALAGALPPSTRAFGLVPLTGEVDEPRRREHVPRVQEVDANELSADEQPRSEIDKIREATSHKAVHAELVRMTFHAFGPWTRRNKRSGPLGIVAPMTSGGFLSTASAVVSDDPIGTEGGCPDRIQKQETGL